MDDKYERAAGILTVCASVAMMVAVAINDGTTASNFIPPAAICSVAIIVGIVLWRSGSRNPPKR